jgi:hypothetical protein
MAATILFWATLGIRLAYKKAARGTDVVWIGAELQLQNQGQHDAHLIASAKPDILAEVKAATDDHSKVNLVNRKALQNYIGKLNHVAGIVEFLRPFLSDLYGVLHCTMNSKAPTNCYWTRQWQHVTHWLMAFFQSRARCSATNLPGASILWERAASFHSDRRLTLGPRRLPHDSELSGGLL